MNNANYANYNELHEFGMIKQTVIYEAEAEDDGDIEIDPQDAIASAETMEKILLSNLIAGKEKAEVIKMILEQKDEERYREFKQRLLNGEE